MLGVVVVAIIALVCIRIRGQIFFSKSGKAVGVNGAEITSRKLPNNDGWQTTANKWKFWKPTFKNYLGASTVV